jgi:hypothetical protein
MFVVVVVVVVVFLYCTIENKIEYSAVHDYRKLFQIQYYILWLLDFTVCHSCLCCCTERATH